MKWDIGGPKEKIFLGIPCHDGKLNHGLFSSLFVAGRQLAITKIETGSALTTNFNRLWCTALNARKQAGITHFCMVHSDVWPREHLWLDKMLAIMKKNQADVLSAVIRLKDDSDKTSTALEIPDTTMVNGFRESKMTLEEIAAKYPPTFTDPLILLNTGLMLVDLRKPFAEKVWFEFRDSIHKDEKGTWFASSLSEDYGFTRMARAQGAKLFATTEIKVAHCGGGVYLNQKAEAV